MSGEYCYQFADFFIRSETPLPDLWPARSVSRRLDQVTIRRGEVLDLTQPDSGLPIKCGVCYQCTVDEFVLRTPVAAFLIRKGREVIFEPVTGKPEEDMRPFISGAVMAVLCYQRGIFVMHGCALQLQRKVILLCGASGSGKSTLGYGLTEKGWQLLADEIVPLKKIDGKLLHLPGKRSLYLWEDAAEHFHLPLNELRRVRSELQKYAVFSHASSYPRPAEAFLASIVVLSKAATSEAISLKTVAAVEAFDLLLTNAIYRPTWIEAMQLGRKRFDYCAQAIQSSDIYQLSLYQKKKLLPTVIDRLESIFSFETVTGDTDAPAQR